MTESSGLQAGDLLQSSQSAPTGVAVETKSDSQHSKVHGTRIASNVLVMGIAQVVTWICSLVAVVIMPKYLGDIDLGRFALGSTIISILLVLSDLGSSNYLTKEIARAGTRASVGAYVANALFLRWPTTVIASVGTVAVVQLLDFGHETRLVIYLMLPGLIFLNAAGVLNASLQGIQEMKPVAFAGAIARVFQVSVTVLLLFLGGHCSRELDTYPDYLCCWALRALPAGPAFPTPGRKSVLDDRLGWLAFLAI
jgi:hypothetical protein